MKMIDILGSPLRLMEKEQLLKGNFENVKLQWTCCKQDTMTFDNKKIHSEAVANNMK